MSSPEVAAVVLTYNGLDLVRPCLRSVLAQRGVDLEIVVVDNGSTDGTRAVLDREFPGIRVVALDRNRQFAGGHNAGVAATGAAYVALISNDVTLPPEAIARLVAELKAHPRAAVAGPAVNNLNLDMSRYPRTGSLSLTGSVIQDVFADPKLTFGAAGCSLVYRRDILGAPFDPDYGFFHEEVYLAWRARLVGYEVLRVPEVVVDHAGGATLGALSLENRFYLERNRLLNFLTLFSPWTRARVWPLLWLARILERAGDLRAHRPWAPVRQARTWLRRHRVLIRDKRRALQAQRRVPDREVIRWMSCRVTNDPSWAGKAANALARCWCRMAGLATWEFQKGRR